MATVQILKKKLQVIRSTGKLTKAMKTVSTVKYSKLNSLYGVYEKYVSQCYSLYDTYREDFNSIFSSVNSDAPVCYVLIGGNKGMCGGFNSELQNFFMKLLDETEGEYLVIGCGKKVDAFLQSKKIDCESTYIFDDIPSYEKSRELFEHLKELLSQGRISAVKTVYQSYVNMMQQKPVCTDLLNFDKAERETEGPLFVPDKQTFITSCADRIFTSVLHKRILESALGAQAATLITMRSAYDTACEYSNQLEIEINRKRQSQVTADVIEISAEYSTEREV